MIRLAIALTIFFLGCGFLFLPTSGGGVGTNYLLDTSNNQILTDQTSGQRLLAQ